MQTLLPFADFYSSADCLDSTRLWKQLLEARQLVDALSDPDNGYHMHPACQMWRLHPGALLAYHDACLLACVLRGINVPSDFQAYNPGDVALPPWLGDAAFHERMRARLVDKDPTYYNFGVAPVPTEIGYLWPVMVDVDNYYLRLKGRSTGVRMAKRHFMMLAHPYRPGKDHIAGWLMSEKLDGQRCFWDGGITRGMPLNEVPWANTEKDGRYVVQPTATGLWTRYGKSIQAPDWFLDQLPPLLLDGELYGGRGQFQWTRSVVSRLEPDDRWARIKFMIFGMPGFDDVFADGLINVPNYCKAISYDACKHLRQKVWRVCESKAGFDVERIYLRSYLEQWPELYSKTYGHSLPENPCFEVLEQKKLPVMSSKAEEMAWAFLEHVTDLGGEGVILRHPTHPWEPHRVRHLLKMKKLHDAEGIVTGYVTGRETDKGSKLLGMMGALVLDFNGKRLELSGFTDAERTLGWTEGFCRAEVEIPPFDKGVWHSSPHADKIPNLWARANPETQVPDYFEASAFPRGSKVTFKYRELSDDGIPKEARYWRPR